jgi:hypothetical protein
MKPSFSPYEGEEEYIFVSYSHKDDEKVYRLIQQLYDRGYRIWYDEGIKAGTMWNEIIAQHIKKATLVLLFMSPNAVVSVPVNEEITFAKRNKKPIVPIFLCETKINDGLELQLSLIQWEFYYEYANDDLFFIKLLSSPLFENISTILKGPKKNRKTHHEQNFTVEENITEENAFLDDDFRTINEFFNSSKEFTFVNVKMLDDSDTIFTESEIWELKNYMLDSYEIIFHYMKAKIAPASPYKFFISISMLDEVITDAILSIKQVIKNKSLSVENLNPFNIAAHLAYWWLHHKPVSIHYPNNLSLDDVQIIDGDCENMDEKRQNIIWKLKHINELIAVQISTCYVFNFENCLCRKTEEVNNDTCCIGFEKMKTLVLQKLSYYFAYKTVTPKMLEYILKYIFDDNGILSLKCMMPRKTWKK